MNKQRVLTYVIEYLAAHGGVAPLPSDIERALELKPGTIYGILKDLVIDGELYFRVKGKYWSLAQMTRAK